MAASLLDVLKQLEDGPRTREELKAALRGLDEKVLQQAVKRGFVRSKAAVLDPSKDRAKLSEEFFLTPPGATAIAADPDMYPWPFRT